MIPSGPISRFGSTAANMPQLALADDIVTQLGDDPEVISGAASLVAAEKNFNNFEADTGALCGDPELPATEALRGILPLFDPDVDGADVQNENSAASLESPFDATGLSEAEVAIEQGFTNFVAQDAAGAEVALAGLDAGGAAAGDDEAGAEDDAAGDDAAGKSLPTCDPYPYPWYWKANGTRCHGDCR